MNELFDKINLEYSLIRSKRKSVSITIKTDEGVIVRAPKIFPKSKIEDFLFKKQSWIFQKLREQESQKKFEPAFVDGESLPFCDKDLILSFVEHSKKRIMIELKRDHLIFRFNELPSFDERRKKIIKWYKAQAFQIFTTRTNVLAQRINNKKSTKLIEVKIREYKRRWGSTNNNGVITYNWKTVLAPDEIIDYVIIHEVCHLTHFNHSRKYWDLVAKFDPQYKEHRKWLKDNGFGLGL